jgi:hypothetical protein
VSRFLEAAGEPEPPAREPIPALVRVEAAVRSHLAGDSADLRRLLAEVTLEPLERVLERL